jgi:hypothetical protein
MFVEFETDHVQSNASQSNASASTHHTAGQPPFQANGPTTLALGEEGDEHPPSQPGPTTLALGEEGGNEPPAPPPQNPTTPPVTTLAVGEEGDHPPGKPDRHVTTLALGEEGSDASHRRVGLATTLALGEEEGKSSIPTMERLEPSVIQTRPGGKAILIIGAPDEAHSAFMHQKITARGHNALYFDTRQFPANLKLSLHTGPGSQALGALQSGSNAPFPLEDIQAVYWRYQMGLQLPPVQDPFLLEMAHREIESAIGSLFRMLPCRWVNSPKAVAMHAYKAYQLSLMHQHGIRVPQTLVTNNPKAVLEFYDRLNGRVIYKPVRGGAHTAKLTHEDITPERLAELSKAPVQFQELIEGVDVRAYLVQDDVFAAEIRSTTLDFRDDPQAPIVPVELPNAVIEQCRTAAGLLDLLYTGIDIRKTSTGEYVFLEANPCPMFMYFEQQTGFPISDRLTDLLLGN